MFDKIKNSLARTYKEYRGVLCFFLFVVVPVKSSLADWNWVPTGSMNPTILEGDMVYVNKLAYDLRLPLTLHRLAAWADPERGDIAVFFSPEDNIRLVKRVVAIPGDELEMQNNVIFLNGKPLDYDPLDPSAYHELNQQLAQIAVFAREALPGKTHPVMALPSLPARRYFSKIRIPQGYYFMMGDNRDNSKDSRYFGLVKRELIVGKAKGVIVSIAFKEKFQPRLTRTFSSLN